MKRLLVLALAFGLAPLAAWAQPAATYYRIDLAPTGVMMAKDLPVQKGSAYLFHAYPAGTLMSLRRSEIKLITKISAETAAAETAPPDNLVVIGTLAMQGGSTQAGAANASAVRSKAATGPKLGEGFYSDLKMGESLASDAGRSGDYAVGRFYASPPATGVQSAPGAPPTMPSATNGQSPPQ